MRSARPLCQSAAILSKRSLGRGRGCAFTQADGLTDDVSHGAVFAQLFNYQIDKLGTHFCVFDAGVITVSVKQDNFVIVDFCRYTGCTRNSVDRLDSVTYISA